MTAPTQNWLDAALKYGATPILVYRMPDRNVYFASEPGHFPDGSGEPYHSAIIKKGGLPAVTREVQSKTHGRMNISVGNLTVVDTGAWDGGFDDYQNTIRGAKLEGYVTFPGLDWSDAVKYLNARVTTVKTNDKSTMTLSLQDATAEKVANAWLAEGTYTSQKLGDVMKQRLLDAGLTYPDDFDTAAWTAWVATGEPGDYTVTGTWSEGEAMGIIDGMLDGTQSVYGFGRDGKFTISMFSDLGPSPTVDVDLTLNDTILLGGDMTLHEPVFRKETVKYNAGASEVSKTVDLLTTDPWWPTARENEPVDPGIDGSADATNLASDRLLLNSAEHAEGRVMADSRMLAYDLLAVVKHDFAKHLLPGISPVNHQVIKIKEDPNKGGVELGLWVNLGAPPQP